MAMPIHFVRRAMKMIMTPVSSSSPSSSSHKDTLTSYAKSSSTTSLLKSQLIYSISLLALFTSNLLQHMTGFTGPPSIFTFGIINNLTLGSLLYQIWWRKQVRDRKETTNANPTLSPQAVTTMSYFIMNFFVAVAYMTSEEQDEKIRGPFEIVINLYVVSTMGRLSYMYTTNQYCSTNQGSSQKKRWKDLFSLWKQACFLLVLIVVFGEAEPKLCSAFGPNQESWQQRWFSRLYHSIFLHTVVTSLFGTVAESTFRLVEVELSLVEDNKPKES